MVFAPISPERMRDLPDYELRSMGDPADIGTGSVIDAATLLNPQLRPFVIPVGTYGTLTPSPILTLAVDRLLVARRDLESTVVYDLVTDLVSLRPALAALRPGLFQDISGEFDPSSSTFISYSPPMLLERILGIMNSRGLRIPPACAGGTIA